MDAYGNYASGSYRARALQTGNFAQKQKHDVKQTLSEVSSAVHHAKRRASQVIFTGAAEMSVEARLHEEFRSYMINNPLEDEGSFRIPSDQAVHASTAHDSREESRKEDLPRRDSEELEHQQHAMHKRMAAQQMKGMKGRRQSFVMGSDGSSAASMLGQLRGLRDYGPPGTGSEAAAAKPEKEKKVLASATKSNPVLKKLMRRSRLLGDLDASSSDDEAEEEVTTSGRSIGQGKKSFDGNSLLPEGALGASRATGQSGGLMKKSFDGNSQLQDAEPDTHSHGGCSTAAAAPGPGPGHMPPHGARTGRRMSVVLANIPAGTQSAPCSSRIRPSLTAKPHTWQSPSDLSSALGLPAPKENLPSPRVGRRASIILPSDDEASMHYETSSSREVSGHNEGSRAPGASRRGSTVANTSRGSSLSQLGREPSMSRSLSMSRNALLDISAHGGSMMQLGAHVQAAVQVTSQSHDGTHCGGIGGGGGGFLNKMKGWISRR